MVVVVVGRVQMFDREFVEAILQEWFKTVSDLPAGIRQAVELVSWGAICFLLENCTVMWQPVWCAVLTDSVVMTFIIDEFCVLCGTGSDQLGSDCEVFVGECKTDDDEITRPDGP